MHYEVELGLVMGKTVRDLDPEDTKGAMDAIEGNTALSLILTQDHLKLPINPFNGPNFLCRRIPSRYRYDRSQRPGRSQEERSPLVHR